MVGVCQKSLSYARIASCGKWSCSFFTSKLYSCTVCSCMLVTQICTYRRICMNLDNGRKCFCNNGTISYEIGKEKGLLSRSLTSYHICTVFCRHTPVCVWEIIKFNHLTAAEGFQLDRLSQRTKPYKWSNLQNSIFHSHFYFGFLLEKTKKTCYYYDFLSLHTFGNVEINNQSLWSSLDLSLSQG